MRRSALALSALAIVGLVVGTARASDHGRFPKSQLHLAVHNPNAQSAIHEVRHGHSHGRGHFERGHHGYRPYTWHHGAIVTPVPVYRPPVVVVPAYPIYRQPHYCPSDPHGGFYIQGNRFSFGIDF